MSLETRIFDPATYLDSDEARATYITEALETGDPVFIADALGVVTKAHGLNTAARETGLSGGEPKFALGPDGTSDLGRLLRVIRALGLRVTVRPDAP